MADLNKLVFSKKPFHKGEWAPAGHKTWSVTTPDLGTLYVQVVSTAAYRDSKACNIIKIVLGTDLSRENVVENAKEVMETVYFGETVEKWTSVRSRLSKRLFSQFGIKL